MYVNSLLYNIPTTTAAGARNSVEQRTSVVQLRSRNRWLSGWLSAFSSTLFCSDRSAQRSPPSTVPRDRRPVWPTGNSRSSSAKGSRSRQHHSKNKHFFYHIGGRALQPRIIVFVVYSSKIWHSDTINLTVNLQPSFQSHNNIILSYFYIIRYF